MTTRKSIDKVAKLLDLLDKHIKEQNCRHSPKELLREYEIDDCLNFIDNIEKNKFVECFESLSYLITLTSPLIVSNLIHKRPAPCHKTILILSLVYNYGAHSEKPTIHVL